MRRFIAENDGKGQVQWVVEGDKLHFVKEKKDVKEIPSMKMINLTLDYATELNRII